MAVGLVITVLTCMIITWVYFSMTGTDESTVTSQVGLNKWYVDKQEARIIDLEEVKIERDIISKNGHEKEEQDGYKLIVEHYGKGKESYRTSHYFYNESYQDKEIITRQMKGKTITVWRSRDGYIYVPHEALNEERVLEVNGIDKTFIYTIITAIILGIITGIIVLFISPLWLLVHFISIIITVIMPYMLIYMEEDKSVRKRVHYKSVGAVNLYTMQEGKENIKDTKLLKRTVPVVLLDEESGYLGYSENRINAILDEQGDVDVHIAKEHRIPEIVKRFIHDYID